MHASGGGCAPEGLVEFFPCLSAQQVVGARPDDPGRVLKNHEKGLQLPVLDVHPSRGARRPDRGLQVLWIPLTWVT